MSNVTSIVELSSKLPKYAKITIDDAKNKNDEITKIGLNFKITLGVVIGSLRVV